MKKTIASIVQFASMAAIVLLGGMAIGLATPAGQASAASDATRPATPAPGSASDSDPVAHCKHSFLGLKPWYQYIGNEMNYDTCNVDCFNVFTVSDPNECGQKSSDVPLVLLVVVDDLLRIAALVSLGFIIVGAFKYVGSQGNPESTGKAQSTIVNALIGLAIALTAVAIVSFIGNKLGT